MKEFPLGNEPLPDRFISAYERLSRQQRAELDDWYEHWLMRWKRRQGIEVPGSQSVPGLMTFTVLEKGKT